MEFQHLVPDGPSGAVSVDGTDAPVRVLLSAAWAAVHAVFAGVQHLSDHLQRV